MLKYCHAYPECHLTQPTIIACRDIASTFVANPFERVSIDIVGPLNQEADGHMHILILIDYATQYPETEAFRSTTSSVIAQDSGIINHFFRLSFP